MAKEDIKGYVIQQTANRDGRQFVNKKQSFDGSNVFARWQHRPLWQPDDDIYAVFSYGTHHPMFVYSSLADTWYENGEVYNSNTTKKHYAQFRPSQPTEVKREEFVKRVVSYGFVGAAKQRVTQRKKLTRAEAWVGGQWR